MDLGGEVGSRSREGAGGLISQLGLPWSWGGGLGAAAGLLPPPPPCSPSWEMSLPRLVGLCLNNHAVSVPPPPPAWLHAVGLARGHFLPPPSLLCWLVQERACFSAYPWGGGGSSAWGLWDSFLPHNGATVSPAGGGWGRRPGCNSICSILPGAPPSHPRAWPGLQTGLGKTSLS